MMSNEEIFRNIALDIYKIGESGEDVTIWMTKDLFNRLLPDQFMLQKDSAMITLFGCRIKVVIFPCGSMQWIVGHEGTAEENE